MAFLKLQFRPGVNRDQTNYTGEGSYWDSEKVRFFAGFPQKIGGWGKHTVTTVAGTCRQMWGWITTFSDNFVALGTNEKVYIDVGGNLYDVTPLRATTAAGDVTFAATDGSATITVADTAHGAGAGDYVTFSGAVTLGGLITADVLNQNYKVVTTPTADTYTITATATANASDIGNGGASVVGEYEITIGTPGGTYGYGFGAGTYSRGTYGSGTTTPVKIAQRDWWVENFDNDMFMNIRNGAPYYWTRGSNADPAVSLAVRAVSLTAISGANEVPVKVGKLILSQSDKHLVALGAVPYGSSDEADFDPLLIRWATQDNPAEWEPKVTNSAGFLRCTHGSYIICGVITRQEMLIWTESHLYGLQFLGNTDVFGLQEYGDNITIASPRCVTTVNTIAYWMGIRKFYVYSGRVETLPCTVTDYVFDDFDYGQRDQVVSGSNEEFHEIWWFYPSNGSSTNDKYVVFNYLENVWYYGTMERTAWLDSPLRSYPQAVSTDFDTQLGTIYNHEYGVDADGTAMEAYIQTNDVDLDDGFKLMLTRRVLPDVSFGGSTAGTDPAVTFEIRSRKFPGTSLTDGTDTASITSSNLTTYTKQLFMRVRARQMALKLSSNKLGTQWALGTPRVQVRADGEQ
tara:strand:- start:772 stop:2655 length:1884 start_codon:yes stop_codon:yes gene_type:complete